MDVVQSVPDPMLEFVDDAVPSVTNSCGVMTSPVLKYPVYVAPTEICCVPTKVASLPSRVLFVP